mmetsp:Transcript_103014/g.125919  ORF Transcript_103014/g.125919 Transcript_103014/m.125919 type:complete len:252 (-) Transcript_103014:222-977(-)
MILDAKISHKVRLRWQLVPIQGWFLCLCLGDALPLLVDQSCVVLLSDLRVLLRDLAEVCGLVLGQQSADHGAASACIGGVNHTFAVLGGQLHSGVTLGGSGYANHQRHLHVSGLHLFCNVLHLVQGWSDQPRQANRINLLLEGFVQDFFARHHDARVNDHQHNAVVLWLIGIFAGSKRGCTTLLLHERGQVCHSLLHDTGAFDHLWQEHLSRTKEIADGAHSLHQRTLNDMQRNFQLRSGLLNVAIEALVH